MNNIIPEFVKPLIRFVYYKKERDRFFREFLIRKKQNCLFKKQVNADSSSLILFFIDGANWFTGYDDISGGILSIASIYEETEKLHPLHKSQVIMATLPDCRHLLAKHTQFPNNIPVFRYTQLKHFRKLNHVLIHIPEYQFNLDLISKICKMFNYLPKESIHINILNQNIELMPEPDIISEVKQQGFFLTQTTAHEQYSTKEIRDKYAIPLHKLSVYATPQRYNFIHPKQKESLILLSPDIVKEKEGVVSIIKEKLPEFQIKIINGITYMDYLKLIEKAKYMITFGEGLDFYFVETVFSGGVSFAKYNEAFFTEDFRQLHSIFKSYEEMAKNICCCIKELEANESSYKLTNKQQFNACYNIYNDTYYKENLSNFYKQNYLYQ
ncbi:MAG: hypothetical protein N4A71_05930 [Carboxylicivirga sp.]|jgi:hypothetical protein|nr:hypothetical protein [Carboxylicivirga sp.]